MQDKFTYIKRKLRCKDKNGKELFALRFESTTGSKGKEYVTNGLSEGPDFPVEEARELRKLHFSQSKNP